MAKTLVIAIDGPAGAGKSAAAREVARRLHLAYLDTGAMYRAVGLAAVRAGIRFPLDAEGERRVTEIAAAILVSFVEADGGQRVLIAGDDVSEAIRTPEVAQAASIVSALPAVRQAMVTRQRELAARHGGVVEGRDIGTVVFPQAQVKLFVTASPEVRARRRFEELRRRRADVRWEEVVEEQRERDRRDTTRLDSPLRPAHNAIILDTSQLTLEEVVERVLQTVDRALTG